MKTTHVCRPQIEIAERPAGARCKRFRGVVGASVFALSLVALMAARDAHALDLKLRILSANPVSYCQTALPAFDGQVRKRPLAMRNEGASPAFITCAFTRHASEPIFLVRMFASNSGAASQNLTCTLVPGSVKLPGGSFIAKTATLLPGSSRTLLQWEDSDLGDAISLIQYSMTCSLPPGVELNDSHIFFLDDVAAF